MIWFIVIYLLIGILFNFVMYEVMGRTRFLEHIIALLSWPIYLILIMIVGFLFLGVETNNDN